MGLVPASCDKRTNMDEEAYRLWRTLCRRWFQHRQAHQSTASTWFCDAAIWGELWWYISTGFTSGPHARSLHWRCTRTPSLPTPQPGRSTTRLDSPVPPTPPQGGEESRPTRPFCRAMLVVQQMVLYVCSNGIAHIFPCLLYTLG